MESNKPPEITPAQEEEVGARKPEANRESILRATEELRKKNEQELKSLEKKYPWVQALMGVAGTAAAIGGIYVLSRQFLGADTVHQVMGFDPNLSARELAGILGTLASASGTMFFVETKIKQKIDEIKGILEKINIQDTFS